MIFSFLNLMALAKYIKILIIFLALPLTEDWQHANAMDDFSLLARTTQQQESTHTHSS
jgi:hypothetical protein